MCALAGLGTGMLRDAIKEAAIADGYTLAADWRQPVGENAVKEQEFAAPQATAADAQTTTDNFRTRSELNAIV